MSGEREDDTQVGYAIELLLGGNEAWRDLVRNMVRRWPESAPLELVFSIVSAAAAIEENFRSGGAAHESAQRGYRVAALLAVDVYAMQILGMPRATGADCLAYWKHDPFFLEL
jgi:hypothetical protein